MGWFWGTSKDDKPPVSTGEDPLRSLDPSLREFLKKESPIKYSSTNPPQSSQPSPPVLETQSKAAPVVNTSTGSSEEAKRVPPQSLYKDGRYAHLWATYQPQQAVEAESKSDAEKINDVLEGYKYRKAEIGRAALENCAMEQWDVNECFSNGGVKARMTMCRAENRKLERCYLMQARFLKALGYLSALDRPAEVDEKIQMHADTLYHRMLEQEAAVEAAKAEGKPIPTFPPLMSRAAAGSSQTSESSIAHKAQELAAAKSSELSPAVQKQLEEQTKGLSQGEKELAERAIAAELKAGEEVASQLGSIFRKQEDERKRRKEQGKETIADYLGSFFSSK